MHSCSHWHRQCALMYSLLFTCLALHLADNVLCNFMLKGPSGVLLRYSKIYRIAGKLFQGFFLFIDGFRCFCLRKGIIHCSCSQKNYIHIYTVKKCVRKHNRLDLGGKGLFCRLSNSQIHPLLLDVLVSQATNSSK